MSEWVAGWLLVWMVLGVRYYVYACLCARNRVSLPYITNAQNKNKKRTTVYVSCWCDALALAFPLSLYRQHLFCFSSCSCSLWLCARTHTRTHAFFSFPSFIIRSDIVQMVQFQYENKCRVKMWATSLAGFYSLTASLSRSLHINITFITSIRMPPAPPSSRIHNINKLYLGWNCLPHSAAKSTSKSDFN